MVSKTFVCLLLLAAVTATLAKPQRKYRDSNEEKAKSIEEYNQNGSNESTDRVPIDMQDQLETTTGRKHQRRYHQDDKKSMNMHSSSDEESQENTRKIKLFASQEDMNEYKTFKTAPEHKRVNHSKQDMVYSQQQKHNQQKFRNNKDEVDSNENNFQERKNHIAGRY